VAAGEGVVPVAVKAVVVVKVAEAVVAADRYPSGPLLFSGRQVWRILGTHRERS
jgi:hypothetical protein